MLLLFHHPQLRTAAPSTPSPREGIQEAAPDLVSSQSGGRGSSAGPHSQHLPLHHPTSGPRRRCPRRGGEMAALSVSQGVQYLWRQVISGIDSGCQEENKNACSSLSRVHARCRHYQLILMPLSSRGQCGEFLREFPCVTAVNILEVSKHGAPMPVELKRQWWSVTGKEMG